MKTQRARIEGRKKRLKRELKRLKKALVRLGAKKIILFGSFARGIIGRTTDIDLLVIKDTNATFAERLAETYNSLIPRVSTDILVYTQEELDELSKWNIFIRRILKEGKVIYAA